MHVGQLLLEHVGQVGRGASCPISSVLATGTIGTAGKVLLLLLLLRLLLWRLLLRRLLLGLLWLCLSRLLLSLGLLLGWLRLLLLGLWLGLGLGRRRHQVVRLVGATGARGGCLALTLSCWRLLRSRCLLLLHLLLLGRQIVSGQDVLGQLERVLLRCLWWGPGGVGLSLLAAWKLLLLHGEDGLLVLVLDGGLLTSWSLLLGALSLRLMTSLASALCLLLRLEEGGSVSATQP